MYTIVDSSHALFLSHRVDAGANFTTRYPDDDYDRIWEPENGFGFATNLKNEAVTIDVSKAEDKPPLAMLQDAVATTGTAWGVVPDTELAAKSVLVYITACVSEVTRLSSTDKRSIEVQIDNVPYSKPIIPPFGSVSVLHITNRTANSNTNLSIVAAADSTLPPLINAYEVYTISDALTSGTNSDDVKGSAALQKKYNILQKWSGDPCLPSPFSWEWLECNTDASLRVIALNLSSFGLSGTLPDFSSMTPLETIDLHNNSIYGQFPSFFGSLPRLKLLNLADNRFNGTIPNSLYKNKNLKLIVTGNCLIGMSCKPEKPLPSSSAPSSEPPSSFELGAPNGSPTSNYGQPPFNTTTSAGSNAISPSRAASGAESLTLTKTILIFSLLFLLLTN